MKALVIEEFGGPENLKEVDLPKPTVADNEVLIHIYYTAVNPVDWKIAKGWFKDSYPHHFPVVLGWDAAGVIQEVGKNVKKFKKKDEVYAFCRKPHIQWGTYAELISLDAEFVALKPKNISFAQAAAIPLGGLTAWQALFDAGKLKEGQSVLIHAGAGGVGSLAIQFAKQAGAKIYTTASQINHDYVKSLGAYQAIDYTKDNFTSHIKLNEPEGVDLVFDCVGGNSLAESYNIVKKGGKLVSIVEKLDPARAKEHQIQTAFVFVSPNGKQLAKITKLIEEGKVIPPHIEEMQLADASFAHERIMKGHTKGKIVLKV